MKRAGDNEYCKVTQCMPCDWQVCKIMQWKQSKGVQMSSDISSRAACVKIPARQDKCYISV